VARWVRRVVGVDISARALKELAATLRRECCEAPSTHDAAVAAAPFPHVTLLSASLAALARPDTAAQLAGCDAVVMVEVSGAGGSHVSVGGRETTTASKGGLISTTHRPPHLNHCPHTDTHGCDAVGFHPGGGAFGPRAAGCRGTRRPGAAAAAPVRGVHAQPGTCNSALPVSPPCLFCSKANLWDSMKPVGDFALNFNTISPAQPGLQPRAAGAHGPLLALHGRGDAGLRPPLRVDAGGVPAVGRRSGRHVRAGAEGPFGFKPWFRRR
jgi:hypothetical protein